MRFNNPRFSTLRFIFIAVVFMLLADTYLFHGKRSYIEEARQNYYAEQVEKEQELLKDAPVLVMPDNGEAYFENVPSPQPSPEGRGGTLESPLPGGEDLGEGVQTVPDGKIEGPHPDPLPKGEGVPFRGTARIAIVIDDLGMDIKRSRRVVEELPAPVTLAFLPYGTKTKELSALGKEKGHHLIIHTPMDAVDTKMNIGPMGLHTDMDEAAFNGSFNTILQSFSGYEGINNHMGSRLTQDGPAMTRLMRLLKAHHLYFLDSKTIGNSVAATKAREAGVPYAIRDVFLDHVETREFVDSSLLKVERLALKRGSAIAIGHPKDFTIAGLKAWIPTLKAKGIELVPVSELLVRPAMQSPLPLGEDLGEGGKPVTNGAIEGPHPDPLPQGEGAKISAPETSAPVLRLDLPQTQSPSLY